jgi:hypothetical protein
MSYLYHEARYLYSKIILTIKYPRLIVIRYSVSEIREQRLNGFNSQFGQDYYVLTNFFNGVEGGLFLDVGCNEPIYNNNTACLEKSFKWSGIACDPISHHKEAWREKRPSTQFLPVALGAIEGEREFVEIDNTLMAGHP